MLVQKRRCISGRRDLQRREEARLARVERGKVGGLAQCRDGHALRLQVLQRAPNVEDGLERPRGIQQARGGGGGLGNRCQVLLVCLGARRQSPHLDARGHHGDGRPAELRQVGANVHGVLAAAVHAACASVHRARVADALLAQRRPSFV